MKNKRLNAINCILPSFWNNLNTHQFSLVSKKYCFLIFVLFLSVASNAQVTSGDEEEKEPRKLLSITRHVPVEENTNADVLTFRFTFEVDVQNVDATDFEIDGTTTASITNVVAITGTSVYELSVLGGDLDNFNGRVGLNLNANHDIIHANRYSISTEEPDIDESYLLDNTIDGTISVITTIASSITDNSALSGGEVITEGETTVTNRGVCWSTNPNPNINNNITSDGSGGGVFTSSITNLTSETTYYYRAYATNSSGTVYGEEYSITTPCIDPISASAITGNTEICPGGSTDLTAVGGALNNATEWRWYSESCGGILIGSGTTINVSPLTSATYYVRAEGDCVNPSSCISITVTVQDYEGPVITCPADVVTNNGLESCSAIVNGIEPLSLNNNCGSPTISYTLEGVTTGSGISDASGTTFNLGETIVEYTAVDGSGNSASCSFTVTVNDNENPIISCPADVTVNSVDENCSVEVNEIAPISISDNCESTTVSYTLIGATTATGVDDASGNIFNVGVTTIEYTVIDGSGNTASCSFNVTVIGNDNENPSISCPADITVNNDAGDCSAVVTGIAPNSISDNCGTPTVTFILSGATTGEGSYDASGTTFNLGETMVEYTAVDGSGNSASCSFTVTVNDNESPLILCLADTSVFNNPGVCSAVVTGITPKVVSDNCELTVVTYTLSGATTGTGNNDVSGTSFNLGVTTVEYTVTDGDGYEVSCAFTVTVTDNEKPVIVCPSDVTVNSEEGSCSAVVNGIAPITVSDNCGTPTITYTLSGKTEGSGVADASGTVFNIGETIVTYTTTDGFGNTDSSFFTVTINESVKPVAITKDLTIELDSLGFASITVEEINNNSTDNCGIETMFLDKTSFWCGDIGENVVTLTVVDNAGNIDKETAIVTVLDNIVPIFNPYGDVGVCADEGETTAVVYFPDPVVWDNCYTTVTQIEGQPSGSVFSTCGNIIRYRATDQAGNTDEISFTVYVLVHTDKPSRAFSPDIPYCFNSKDSILLKAVGATECSGASAQWFHDEDLNYPVFVSPTTSRTKAPLKSTTYYVRFKGCNTTEAIPFDIEVLPLPEIDAGQDVDIFQGTELQLNATYNQNYRYIWSLKDISSNTTINDLLSDAKIRDLFLSDATIYNPVFSGKVVDEYELSVLVTDENYCKNYDTLIVNVVNLKVYSGFTPNNDGYNDFWMIENIKLYPNNKVRVFDRNNTLVYEKRSYDNSWKGTFDARTGEKLPAGTYFYILELSGGIKVYKGVVTILGN